MPLQKNINYRANHLCVEKTKILDIAKTQETPFYLYSSAQIKKNYKELKTAFKEKINICYAVKANSNLAILNLLKEQGSGFDLVSGGELYRVQNINGAPNKIVFSGVGKKKKEILEAIYYQGEGILSFQVESLDELKHINEIAKQEGKSVGVCLRFNPDVNAKTHPNISTGLKKNKFGMFKKDILEIVNNQSTHFENIRILGLSVHIGSQIIDLKAFENAFKKTDDLLFGLKEKLPHLEMIDLGGGIGITYQKEKVINLKRYASTIERIFGKKSHWKGKLNLFIEPGRSLVANAGILISKILYRKHNQSRKFLILDAGMNDLMRPALYQGIHELVAVKKPKSSVKNEKVDVVGPICESSDLFLEQAKLPTNLESQDLVALLNCGAYGFSMANQYNSHPRCAEVLVEKNEFRVIRKRENYSDLIQGEVV